MGKGDSMSSGAAKRHYKEKKVQRDSIFALCGKERVLEAVKTLPDKQREAVVGYWGLGVEQVLGPEMRPHSYAYRATGAASAAYRGALANILLHCAVAATEERSDG